MSILFSGLNPGLFVPTSFFFPAICNNNVLDVRGVRLMDVSSWLPRQNPRRTDGHLPCTEMSTWQRPTNYSTTTTPISIFSIITRRVFGVTGGRHARSPRSRHAGGLAVWELGLAAALEGGIEVGHRHELREAGKASRKAERYRELTGRGIHAVDESGGDSKRLWRRGDH